MNDEDWKARAELAEARVRELEEVIQRAADDLGSARLIGDVRKALRAALSTSEPKRSES